MRSVLMSILQYSSRSERLKVGVLGVVEWYRIIIGV